MRAALETAVELEETATVRFELDTPDVPEISPPSALPSIVNPTILDMTPLAAGNVVIDGSGAGESHGLQVVEGPLAIKGELEIRCFAKDGIHASVPVSADRLHLLHNGQYGIRMNDGSQTLTINRDALSNGGEGGPALPEAYSRIRENGLGGIRVNGELDAFFLEVENNGTAVADPATGSGGDGIWAEGDTSLTDAKIVGNKGIGAYANLDARFEDGAACGNTVADLVAGEELTTIDTITGDECANGDIDDDGICDEDEPGAPNCGDGNADGVMDDMQSNVASFPMGDDYEYVTLELPSDAALEETVGWMFCRLPDSPPEISPTSPDYIDFTMRGIDPGSEATAKIILHDQAVQPEAFHRYGPTSEQEGPHWYEFLHDGATGAQIFADHLMVHYKDGARGDDDLSENGEIRSRPCDFRSYVAGDIDENGRIGLKDAIIAIEASTGKMESNCQPKADTNNDNRIGTIDACWILKRIAESDP